MGVCIFISQLQIKNIWKLWSFILSLAYWCFQNCSSNVSHLNPDRREGRPFHLCVTGHDRKCGCQGMFCDLFQCGIHVLPKGQESYKVLWVLSIVTPAKYSPVFYLKDIFHYLLPVCHSWFVLPKQMIRYSLCASAEGIHNSGRAFLIFVQKLHCLPVTYSPWAKVIWFQLKINSFIRSQFTWYIKYG